MTPTTVNNKIKNKRIGPQTGQQKFARFMAKIEKKFNTTPPQPYLCLRIQTLTNLREYINLLIWPWPKPSPNRTLFKGGILVEPKCQEYEHLTYAVFANEENIKTLQFFSTDAKQRRVALRSLVRFVSSKCRTFQPIGVPKLVPRKIYGELKDMWMNFKHYIYIEASKTYEAREAALELVDGEEVNNENSQSEITGDVLPSMPDAI